MGKKNLTKATPAAPVRTDLDLAKLSGSVKQAMQITYKAHYRDGKVIQGNLETDSKSTYTNKLVTYGKDGNKTREETYNYHGIDIHILNKNKIQDEIIHLDLKGNLERRTVHTFTKHNEVRDSFTYKNDGSLAYKVIKTLNDDERSLEEIQYGADEKRIIARTTHAYDDKGRRINTTHYNIETGKVQSTFDKIYNEEGKIIESKNQYYTKSSASMNYWAKSLYNKQGDCIEYITLNNDGTIKETHKYTPEYDKDGKRIIPYHPPYNHHELKEGETEKTVTDVHDNWIKKTIFKKNIPVYMILRELVYYGENEERELVHPITTEEPAEIEDTSNQPEELTEEEAKWLTEEPTRQPDNFALLRYYALRYQDVPSVIDYTGPYIEACSLLEKLMGDKHQRGQQIHSVSTMDKNGKEQVQKYTLTFPYYYGFMLHAAQITQHKANQFDLAGKDINTEDGFVKLSHLQLLRPSKLADRDDDNFEDVLDRVIEECSIKKLPNKPVIHMIEQDTNGFVMRQHPVDDDFEIKDLDINYGYGFQKFHDDLMERFSSGTKGLVLLHGQPGTGKTYYIRHLLRKMVSSRKVVIYMPPNLVDHLAEPGFMTFLMQNVKHWSGQGFFCVLLIEDAEPLLAQRQEGVRIQGVTNLLNMTDGLLNDMLNIQIVCTFNVDLKKLDSALLRPGRLLARKEFKPLSQLDANLLAQRIGINHHFKKRASLGEIYAMKKNQSILIHNVKSEDGASTIADDF